MRVVLQRVKKASVTGTDRVTPNDAVLNKLSLVASEIVGSIGPGLCLLVGLGHQDGEKQLEELATKICRMKLFSQNSESRWQFSVKDSPEPLQILAVSQFTLYARTDNGSKPDFHEAMSSAEARVLFDRFVEIMREKLGRGVDAVQTGAFGQYMQVEIINDGPVTLVLESKK